MLRWLKNIRWLLNRPPTNLTNTEEPLYCDYCGTSPSLRIYGVTTFCGDCLKKALDKALKGDKND